MKCIIRLEIMTAACYLPILILDRNEAMQASSNEVVDFFRRYIDRKPDDAAPPFTRWLDGRLKECSAGRMAMEVLCRPEMGNPAGLLHGGVQAAIMDELIGMTILTLGEKGFALSIDLHVNFLGKVEIGQKIIARAEIVRSGKRISHAVCEIRDTAGRLVSLGSANLLKTTHASGMESAIDARLGRREI